MPIPKILVDENLLSLVAWYRFAGVDSAAANGISDSELAAQAVAEGRIVLTRDHDLAARLGPQRAVLISHDGRYSQWREAVQATSLPDATQWFSRCAICNETLRAMSDEDRSAEVGLPAGVRASRAVVCKCDRCGRAYWEGSHFRRIRSFLEASALELKGGTLSASGERIEARAAQAEVTLR